MKRSKGHIAQVGRVLLGAILFAATAHAQEQNEKKLGWADAAELSFVATGGNAEAKTLGLRNVLTHTWEDSLFTLDAGALRASTGTIVREAIGSSASDFAVVKESVSSVTAENYMLRGRYDRVITERLFWYAGTGWDRNIFAGIQNRFEGTGGLGHVWFDDDTGRLRTSYGLSIVNQEDVVENPDVSSTYAALRLSSDYKRPIGSSAEFSNVSVMNQNLGDISDLRFDMVNAISVSLRDGLALKLTHQLLFDNLPSLETLSLINSNRVPVGVDVKVPLDKVDTILNVALVVSF